jgi:adenosylcobinamide-GDP ribazoletransferase
MRLLDDLSAAFAFLTQVPVPNYAHDTQTIARASKFFPLVGFVVASIAYLLYRLLAGHSDVQVQCALVLCLLVLLTGGIHEDGLADAADGFGGGWTRERTLKIMRDSRIGSYGAVALVLSLLVRFVLLTKLSPEHFWAYLASAHVLCRWSTLPLSLMLPAARVEDGKGAAIAQKVSRLSFIFGTAVAVAICTLLLRWSFLGPLLSSVAVVLLSAAYYWYRIRGVTGDCFGATNQIVEITTYLCGVLH